MRETVLLTGGTGTLGRLVLSRLLEAGDHVRVLSRTAGPPAAGVEHVIGDLGTGDGIAAAVDGVATIVHCAGSAKGDEVKARQLVRAAEPAGVRHIVNISVVGADLVPVVSATDRAMFGYYAAQAAAELVVSGSAVPWTTLRATQFHDLVLMTVRQLAKLPVVPVPSGFRFQPVDAGEVAARLVQLAHGEPAGRVTDLGGPRVYTVTEVVRSYLAATGRRRPLLPMRIPGRAAAALRDGANLLSGGASGTGTWEEFLRRQV